jgi:integrase
VFGRIFEFFCKWGSVRGPKHVVKTGKTAVLDAKEWRKLIDSIPTDTRLDRRDRALIATLTYSFARINAALKMKVGMDLRPKGAGWRLRLHEKAGKHHEMPCHHALAEELRVYIDAAGIAVLAFPLTPSLILLPLLGVMLNGTSSVLYGTVPELVSAQRIERAFALFYTGTLGSSALAPVLYGWFGDAAGPVWATGAAAVTALAVVPFMIVLSPRLASSSNAQSS